MPTFSWEEKPGVSKVLERKTTEEQNYNYFSGTDDGGDGSGVGDDTSHTLKLIKLPPPPGPPEKYRTSFRNDLQIPPPPCAFFQPPLRCSSRKKNDDPFLIAYKECTKSSRKDHIKLGKFTTTTTGDDGDDGDGHGGSELRFGLKKNISFLNCKHSCSSLVSDSIISTSQFPVSRSRKETRRHQN